jgi:hypothetical protein
MERKDVEGAVIETLRQLQELSGDEHSVITQETRPLKDLEGFDSHRDLEFSVTLAERLPIDGDTRWCVAPDGERLLTVTGIVDRIIADLNT